MVIVFVLLAVALGGLAVGLSRKQAQEASVVFLALAAVGNLALALLVR